MCHFLLTKQYVYILDKKTILSNSKCNSCMNFNGTAKECSRNITVSLVEK